MKTKLGHLIIASLTSLRFVFSAISYASAARQKRQSTRKNTTSASGFSPFVENLLIQNNINPHQHQAAEMAVNSNNYVKFTTEELLSIFKVEAQHICKSPDEVYSIAESVLNDFIKWHGKYVRFT